MLCIAASDVMSRNHKTYVVVALYHGKTRYVLLCLSSGSEWLREEEQDKNAIVR